MTCLRCNTPRKCAIHGCSPLTWPAEAEDAIDLRQERANRVALNLAQQLDVHLAEAVRRAGADPSEAHRLTRQSHPATLRTTYYVDNKPVLEVGPPRMEGDNFTVPFRHLLPEVPQ